MRRRGRSLGARAPRDGSSAPRSRSRAARRSTPRAAAAPHPPSRAARDPSSPFGRARSRDPARARVLAPRVRLVARARTLRRRLRLVRARVAAAARSRAPPRSREPRAPRARAPSSRVDVPLRRGGCLPRGAREEAADAEAAERLARLRALVANKRLLFAFAEAAETCAAPIDAGSTRDGDPSSADGGESRKDDAEKPPELASLARRLESAVAEDPESEAAAQAAQRLEDAIDACESVLELAADAEAQIKRLDRLFEKLFSPTNAAGVEAAFGAGGVGDGAGAAHAEASFREKVREFKDKLERRAKSVVDAGLRYADADSARVAVNDAAPALARFRGEDASSAGARVVRPVVATVERVGSKAKSARGLLSTGVSRLREKPLSAAASAAEYTRGVWSRLNGGAGASFAPNPALEGLPEPTSLAEKRQARVLKLAVETQDLDRALREASARRDKVLGQGKDSLSRVRLAKTIRESDNVVNDLRREFAVRTLQAEMERILTQLEEEAIEPPSLDGGPDRSDDVELLVAEFGAMDASLRKLVSAVDAGEGDLISDEDLTTLATDIPDLKSRLGVADDDGFTSLSPEVLGERISASVEESRAKAWEGAEFMARGVKMLGGDVSASARFFGRAATGSTLRPREVQTIRRTALDIFTFVPFIIILIIPLTPVGHVLIFSFIQRYFPALFPSQFSGRRQELMKKYEELSRQLKEAERRQEVREEDEALARAVNAVENLMTGGASDAEVAKAAAAAAREAEKNRADGAPRSNSFFKLKGLERMARDEPDVVDVRAREATTRDEEEANENDDRKREGKPEEDPEVSKLRQAHESAEAALIDDDGEDGR